MARSDRSEYDFVIVGAGSAGCTLAGRLSEDPNARVLLLEAGTAKEPLLARVPAAFSRLFRTRHDWAYETEPEPELAGRRLYMPRGKMLGGSSAMNAMIYIRGNPLDYDAWSAAGARGWSYADVLPFFLKAEDQSRGKIPAHGVGGPLRVEDLRTVNPMSHAFVAACQEVGMAKNDDFNSGSQDGTGLYQVTQRGGRRWSAANAYLFPAMQRPNLVVARGVLATRVVIEKERARGVEFLQRGRKKTAIARREVVLAAGAIGSPQLLQLSGVGAADELARLGIPVVVKAEGVGANLQDHPVIGVLHESKLPISLIEGESVAGLFEYIARGTGSLSSNVAEAGAFVRSEPSLPAPDIQFHFGPVYHVDHGFVRPPGHGFTLGPTLVAPTSRGRLMIRSPDPTAPPRIYGNFLTDAAEMKALVHGIKLARDIARARAFDRYRGPEFMPGESIKTDAQLEAYVRAKVELLYHVCATCKMGEDDLAVVDSELRVRGVSGLRVADASVMPVVPRGNTNAPTIMIAERCAAFMKAAASRT
jgi:choline dehydrogenase